MAAVPPKATVTARAMRSPQGPSAGRRVTTLPIASTSAIRSGVRPATCWETWCTSGNARPMLSASTSGRPICAAQATGRRPFEPPISDDMTATARRPVITSRWSRSRTPSSPLGSFSTPDRRRADHAERQQQALGVELRQRDDVHRAVHAQGLAA